MTKRSFVGTEYFIRATNRFCRFSLRWQFFGIFKNRGRTDSKRGRKFFERFDGRTCEVVFEAIHKMARNSRIKSKLLLTQIFLFAQNDDGLSDVHKIIIRQWGIYLHAI